MHFFFAANHLAKIKTLINIQTRELVFFYFYFFNSITIFFFRDEDKAEELSSSGPHRDDNCYKMDHKKRGYVLIFNHMNYEDDKLLPSRDGTNKDRDDLRNLFANMNFDVIVNDDFTYAKIYDELYRGN